MINEPFLTYAEAGRHMGVSRQRAHQLAKERLITIVTLNGRDYVTLRSVKHYLQDVIIPTPNIVRKALDSKR